MPEEWFPDGTRSDRVFYYKVLQKVAPEFLLSLVQNCREQRQTRAFKGVKAIKTFSIHPNFLNPLLSHPF
jgi:hypothetical protein